MRSAAAPAPAVEERRRDILASLNRHHDAMLGFAALLLLVATETRVELSGPTLIGVAQLADILADEERRIIDAFGSLVNGATRRHADDE